MPEIHILSLKYVFWAKYVFEKYAFMAKYVFWPFSTFAYTHYDKPQTLNRDSFQRMRLFKSAESWNLTCPKSYAIVASTVSRLLLNSHSFLLQRFHWGLFVSPVFSRHLRHSHLFRSLAERRHIPLLQHLLEETVSIDRYAIKKPAPPVEKTT